MKTASGLEYIETQAGTGAQATAGKTVFVHYTGKFQNGQVFDSSIPRGEPLAFQTDGQLRHRIIVDAGENGVHIAAALVIPSAPVGDHNDLDAVCRAVAGCG